MAAPQAFSQSQPLLEARNIHKIYELGATPYHALKGVSLEVYQGEMLAIMGPSGSGKSTLMNILGCLDTATYGDLFLRGVNIVEYTDDDLSAIRCNYLGFIFQNFNLLPQATVKQNVALPLMYAGCPDNLRKEKVHTALEMAGVPEEIYNHKANAISGGQMQRVAIARALVNDPDIIFADEPTGNLDSHTGELVLNSFKKLIELGKTIILITHDIDVAAHAHRVYQIKDGLLYKGAQPDALRKAALEQKKFIESQQVRNSAGDQDVF